MVILDPATAKIFTDSIRTLQDDIHREWHTDTFDCWTVNRPAGWSDSDSVEVKTKKGNGRGKLYANGAGRPQGSEMVIHLESPYRFRTVSDAPIESGNLLVINGERVFRVDVAKPEHAEDVLMDVYVSELFSTPNPEVP